MDRRINKKIESYISKFKDDIRDKITDIGLINGEKLNEYLSFVYDYDRLSIDKDDLSKRKRVKNLVPNFDRCCAKRASGEQCTRRKKDTASEYCGTHLKGTPHGIIDVTTNENTPATKRVDVWIQDIQGINYYIDNFNNVYQAEDIIGNKHNPSIIAKYVRNGNKYSIPEFGI